MQDLERFSKHVFVRAAGQDAELWVNGAAHIVRQADLQHLAEVPAARGENCAWAHREVRVRHLWTLRVWFRKFHTFGETCTF